jgi:hypothetical protein
MYVRFQLDKPLSKYSPEDIIEHSKAICKMKIKGGRHCSELTAMAFKRFAKTGIDKPY